MNRGHAATIRIIALACLASVSCGASSARPAAISDASALFAFSRAPESGVTFLSTQMNPVEEAGRMRSSILKDFPGAVDFKPNDNSYIFSQVESMRRANPGDCVLIGALHGDLVTLQRKGLLRPLDDAYAALAGRGFPESLLALASPGGERAYYVPWMQASFVMVANKKALEYLPDGAVLDSLSYDQLLQWGSSIFARTGRRAIGFPAGKNGLMHRFFQGYLYPSFTASTLLRFKSRDAELMWSYFGRLWQFVHPGSLVYSDMSEPLIAGDVWIAWDHTARLTHAFEERADDYVAFPAPVGPEGRGYMAVVSGLAIPEGFAREGDAVLLIDYLTQPAIQARTLSETGFFPVVGSWTEADIPGRLRSLASAVGKQTGSPDSIPTLMPIGLGERGSDYNAAFMMTFSEIVLQGKSARSVLIENAATLQDIVNEAGAPCWAPDVSDGRPCALE
ncbi:MAG: extracellular solute-binding protein [Spirochaetes bacterium]|nr:extracellular solute-binding protein [Spirochaetota bacterium]MBU1079563.1 extracellular solute-binding protein [Spirochaetota bacterium]